LEIGFAFSDPVADGPTVQAADIRALNAEMTTEKGFKFISKIREFTSIPIGLLVYYNLIYKMGIDRFYQIAKEMGLMLFLLLIYHPKRLKMQLLLQKNMEFSRSSWLLRLPVMNV
jgi:tryptophan synthase alpha chain